LLTVLIRQGAIPETLLTEQGPRFKVRTFESGFYFPIRNNNSEIKRLDEFILRAYIAVCPESLPSGAEAKNWMLFTEEPLAILTEDDLNALPYGSKLVLVRKKTVFRS